MPKAVTVVNSITKTISHAADSIAKAADAFISGEMVMAPDSVVAYRKRRCAGCKFNVDGRCTECTCFIDAKVMVATEFCPRRYWKAHTAVPTTKGRTAFGFHIFEQEAALRLLLPPDADLAQRFNDFHTTFDDKKAKCGACERKAWYRKFEEALGKDYRKMNPETRRSLYAIFFAFEYLHLNTRLSLKETPDNDA